MKTLCALTLALATGAASAEAAALPLELQAGWPSLALDGRPLLVASEGPAADLRVDDRWLLAEASARPEVRRAGDAVESVYATPAGPVVDRIEPFPGFPNCFRRRLSFTNRGPKRCDVDGVRLHLGFVRKADAPSWQCQSFAMVEAGPDRTICAAFTSDEDFYGTDLAENGRVTHTVHAAWRLEPGQEAVIGTQYFWVVRGGLERARASAQDWYDAVGLTVADGGPAWVGDLVLYQACAGGSVDSRFSDTGGFAAFSHQLDFIADMGFNAFWLMSVMQHKDPASPASGWNLYDPLDYRKVDPAYGGDEGLTALVKAMRARDFRILCEVVPHGGRAPQAANLPAAWTYDRKGERSRGFGQGMDYSSPEWQAEIRDDIAWMAKTWGFDGWRVDVADGFGTNWRPERAPHVSRAGMGGSLGMLRAIREGHLRSGKPPVITPESGANRPEQARWGQLGYGWDFCFFLDRIRPASLAAADLRRQLTGYFERERGSLPRGMLSIYALNNHDPVVFWGRADRRFGVGLQRALTAVCAVVPGVPMVYQEQEVGSYHYFRRLFWARRRVPEMCRGGADYLSIAGPAEVFSVVRTLSREGKTSRAIGLVNLSPRAVDGEFTLSEGVLPAGSLVDAVSGKSAGLRGKSFRWRLEPYGVAILRVGQKPEGTMPPERHRAESVASQAQPPKSAAAGGGLAWWTEPGSVLAFRSGGITCRLDPAGCTARYDPQPDGSLKVELTAAADVPGAEGDALRALHPASRIAHLAPRVEMLGVDRWFANAESGVYEDRLLRRHFPWPKGLYAWNPGIVWGYEPNQLYRSCLPAGRQWQSAVSPLSAADSRLGFADTAGRGFLLTDVSSNAANTILTDRSEEPEPAPYGLALLFALSDPALNPGWVSGYRDCGWAEVPGAPARPAEPLRVSFTLRPMASFAVPHDAPSAQPTGRFEIGPARSGRNGDRLWFPEPNVATWSDVPVSADGSWDVWLQLRHSERSGADRDLCSHYRITVDGQSVEPEWVKLNVWSTGNGYFGWARLRGVPLKAGRHTLRIETTHTWCALLPKAYATLDANWQP